MSRIGKIPIVIPEKVIVEIKDGSVIVAGDLGKLEQKIPQNIEVKIETGKILVSVKKESQTSRALHGSIRNLIANMIQGVTQGFTKKLEIHGTGYRARIEAEKLILELGFSHPVVIEPILGITFSVQKEKLITVSGVDKILVGDVSAKIRLVKKPDVYKGKGIRYQGEFVRKKAGKAAKIGAGVAKYE